MLLLMSNIVCEDVLVQTQYDGRSVEWKLGNCLSSRVYDNYRSYVQRCCLLPGSHTLTCINRDKSEGWKGGNVQYQKISYCNDFFAFKTFRNIQLKGNNM